MNCESLIKPPKSRVLKSGKVLLKPGESVGEHVTEKREEIIIVLKGTATIIAEGSQKTIETKGFCYIKEGVVHNVVNNSKDELEYVYVVSLFDQISLKNP